MPDQDSEASNELDDHTSQGRASRKHLEQVLSFMNTELANTPLQEVAHLKKELSARQEHLLES